MRPAPTEIEVSSEMLKLPRKLSTPNVADLVQRIREISSGDLLSGSGWNPGGRARRSPIVGAICVDGGSEALMLRRESGGDRLVQSMPWSEDSGERWPAGTKRAPKGVRMVVAGSGMLTRSTRVAASAQGSSAATARWEILSQLKQRNKNLPILARKELHFEDRWTAIAVPQSALDEAKKLAGGLSDVEYTFGPFAAAALSAIDPWSEGDKPEPELILHVTSNWAVMGIGRGGALEILREVPALGETGWSDDGLRDVVRTLEFYRFRMRGGDIKRAIISRQSLQESEKPRLREALGCEVVDVRELAADVIGEDVPTIARALAIGAALSPGFERIDESSAMAGVRHGRPELDQARKIASYGAVPLALLAVMGHQVSRGNEAGAKASAIEAQASGFEARAAALGIPAAAPAPEQPARPPDALDATLRVAASIPEEMVVREIACLSNDEGPLDVAPTRLDLRVSLEGETPETSVRALDHYFGIHRSVPGWRLRFDPRVDEATIAGEPAIDLVVSFDTTVEGL